MQDLFVHKAWIYWVDFLVSMTIGYTAASFYFAAPLSWEKLGWLIVAGCALFRLGSFMHEVVHMSGNTLRTFRLVWNLAAGVPLLTPSFFYESHITHHSAKHYGTDDDGEYLPLAHGSGADIAFFFAQVLWQPLAVAFRFAVLTPISFLHPRLRRWTLERASSFIIDWRYRRPIPAGAPLLQWAIIDWICCLRTIAIFGLVAAGVTHWTRVPQLYVLAVFILSMNYLRTLAAHRYLGNGEKMSHVEQLHDSVNITGGGIVTELFCPLGMRYHALHHLFPSLPYHNMGIAHRRLMRELPEDSAYRSVECPSIWASIKPLVLPPPAPAADRAPVGGGVPHRSRNCRRRLLPPITKV